MIKYEYINFRLVKRNLKTNMYYVESKKGIFLGHIKWFGRWRQYAFFPFKDTVFTCGCLDDIKDFIKGIKRRR